MVGWKALGGGESAVASRGAWTAAERDKENGEENFPGSPSCG